MNDISFKYRLLNESLQKEVNDFLDFLLSKQKSKKSGINSEYKKRILSVSTWTEKDISELEKKSKLFNNLNIPEW